ncbi:MAG: aminotransferase class V-fold PLP-dependent enzyme [Kordiimonadaceae bacterium]|nr:aminotransferase class V-fold PLP-dependent enzyme [Kordiimonadaceae bacterium]
MNFAKIINADVSEVAYVENTTSAEQMIVRGLGLPSSGGHIITDEFHFPGSEALYKGLERRGVSITRIKPRDGKIIPEDIKKAMRPDTKLIAISLVSMLSGFEHDIKAVCDIAHEHGALVYADIIQAAGSLPIDVKKSGLDFAACSTYKWLMGDFGIGFVYTSKNAQSILKRPGYGSMGFSGAGETNEQDDDGFPKNAAGLFTLGTRSYSEISILKGSLPYILDIGVDNIHAHSRIMTDMLKEELPKIGYKLRTPLDSNGPLVVAWKDNARETLTPALNSENIQISTYSDRIRISPSVFNDTNDIEKLLTVLKKAA